MQNSNYKILILYFFFFFLLNLTYGFNDSPEFNAEEEKHQIQELYQRVTPAYMEEIIDNLDLLFDSYVFSDILKDPPKPYEEERLINYSEKFHEIKTNEERPFYEFYRDVKKALSFFRDSNLNINGGKVPLNNEMVNFIDYRICLPFKFYLDYEKNQEVKMFIKEYPECSKYYDEPVRKFIREHEKIFIEKINGTDAFEYLQNFGTEFYKYKNPNSYFNTIIGSIHDNYLSNIPLSQEELKSMKLHFSNKETLETHFHIIKMANIAKENKWKLQNLDNKKTIKEEILDKNNNFFSENNNEEIIWQFQTENGELKCFVDMVNHLNVLFINSFYIEDIFFTYTTIYINALN